PPTLSRMSTRCARTSSRPSSNTANRPHGPAPMMRTSVLIGLDICCSWVKRGDEHGCGSVALVDGPAKQTFGSNIRAPSVRKALADCKIVSPGTDMHAEGLPADVERFRVVLNQHIKARHRRACPGDLDHQARSQATGWPGHKRVHARLRRAMP